MYIPILLISAALAFAGSTPDPGDPDAPPTTPTAIFDFHQEGIFDVHMVCDPRPEDCNPTLLRNVNRISIVDSHSPFGIWVMVASGSTGEVLDGFYGAQIGPTPTTVTAVPRPGSHVGIFSYLNFTIDPATGELKGTLLDYQSRGKMVMTGKPILRLADILRPQPSPPNHVGTLFGEYKGTLTGIPGTLSIAATPGKQVYAFFASDEVYKGTPTFSVRFSDSFYNPATGVLQLPFQNPRSFGAGELAVTINKTAPLTLGSIYFNGFAHAATEFVKSK